MAQLGGARLRDRTERVVALVKRQPGIPDTEVRHRYRRTIDGAHRQDPLTDEAIQAGLADGQIEARTIVELDRMRRPKSVRRLYPEGGSPPQATSRELTGEQLGRDREYFGLTRPELGARLGMTGSWVRVQEQRGQGTLSPYWAERVLDVVEELGQKPTRDEECQQRVVACVRERPGLPLWRVKQILGERKRMARAVSVLVDGRKIVWASAWDSLGRSYPGLYLAADVPNLKRLRQFAKGELRRLRHERGLSAAALGELVGVRGNTVTRWETGVRRPPPQRIEALNEALRP